MGELNIESIKNEGIKQFAKIADTKYSKDNEPTSVFEGNGNGIIDTEFEKSALRGHIQKGLESGEIKSTDLTDDLMESIGLELTKKQKKARKAQLKEEKKAHEAQVKEKAAELVRELTYDSKSQDAKYIKEEIKTKLKEKLDNGEISQELYEAALDRSKGGVNFWQWLQGKQSTQKSDRHSTAHKNQVNFRAYEADENGNRHTVVERLEARLATESKEYVEDGTEKRYTEEQLLNGFKYTDPESGKTIKFKAISKKVLEELVASGKYIKHDDGKYTIAKASEDLRLEIGSDYTADWSKNPKDSELANIAAEMGLDRKGFLGIKNNKAARSVSRQTGYGTSNPIDAGKILGETLKGAGIGALGAMAHEALRPRQIVDASTDLKFNDTVNIDFGSKELAEQFVNSYNGDAKVSVAGGIVQVVTKIGIFDPKVFELTKDILGAAARGAITGAIAGFAMGLLDSKESEKSALPEINCTKFPTVQKLQGHLNGMVKNGDVKPEYARIALMIAKANSDANGNIDCDSFNREIALQKGNNIWNKREVESMGIDTPKTKPTPVEEELIVCTDGNDGKAAVAPKPEKVEVPTTNGVLWPNLAAQYDCLPKQDRNTRTMKVMQAVTDNNYHIENLRALAAKSRELKVPAPKGKNNTWTPAQIAQVKANAKQVFAGVEGFDSDIYVDTLLAHIIGEQKTPTIILEDGTTCERNANIKGTFKASGTSEGHKSGHAYDTVLTGGQSAVAGHGTMTVTNKRTGDVVSHTEYRSKTEADKAAADYIKKHKNATTCCE